MFNGLNTMEDLPYIPFKSHPKTEAIMQKVRQRNAKGIKFWTPGFQIHEHQVTGLAEIQGEVQRYAVSKAPRAKWVCNGIANLLPARIARFSERTIIDPAIMRSAQPSNLFMTSLRRMHGVSGKCRACISDLTTEEEVIRCHSHYICTTNIPGQCWRMEVFNANFRTI